MVALLLVRISMLNKKGEERKTKMLCNLRDPRSRQKLWKCQKRPSHSVSPRRTPSLLKGKASKPARSRRPRPQMSTRSAPSVSPPEPKLRPQQSFPPQPGRAPTLAPPQLTPHRGRPRRPPRRGTPSNGSVNSKPRGPLCLYQSHLLTVRPRHRGPTPGAPLRKNIATVRRSHIQEGYSRRCKRGDLDLR